MFVDAAPTLIIDKTMPKISKHALLVTTCDMLTENHTLGHSSPKELFSPVSGGSGAGICGARLGGRGQKSISRLFKVARKKGENKAKLYRVKKSISCPFKSHTYSSSGLQQFHLLAKEIAKGSTDPGIN